MVASYVYEGFGKVIGQTGGSIPYHFCGLWSYRDDGDAGLLHVGARYYEVETGRWVQKDPWLGYVCKPLTLNPYAYCLNNPIKHVDPSGAIIETVLDVAGIIYDASRGDWVGVGVGIIGLLIPAVPNIGIKGVVKILSEVLGRPVKYIGKLGTDEGFTVRIDPPTGNDPLHNRPHLHLKPPFGIDRIMINDDESYEVIRR